MPQFDYFLFFIISLNLIGYFCLLYFFNLSFVVPNIFFSLRIRQLKFIYFKYLLVIIQNKYKLFFIKIKFFYSMIIDFYINLSFKLFENVF
jgi:hypothetical protein